MKEAPPLGDGILIISNISTISTGRDGGAFKVVFKVVFEVVLEVVRVRPSSTGWTGGEELVVVAEGEGVGVTDTITATSSTGLGREFKFLEP